MAHYYSLLDRAAGATRMPPGSLPDSLLLLTYGVRACARVVLCLFRFGFPSTTRYSARDTHLPTPANRQAFFFDGSLLLDRYGAHPTPPTTRPQRRGLLLGFSSTTRYMACGTLSLHHTGVFPFLGSLTTRYIAVPTSHTHTNDRHSDTNRHRDHRMKRGYLTCLSPPLRLTASYAAQRVAVSPSRWR